MISKSIRTRVSNLMRRDLMKNHAYSKAKKRGFKGEAVQHCSSCDTNFYVGVSDKKFNKLKEEKYPDLTKVQKGKGFQMDHVDPIVPYDKTLHDMTLDEIAERVYCSEDNLNYICYDCHSEKTHKEESQIRKNKRNKS